MDEWQISAYSVTRSDQVLKDIRILCSYESKKDQSNHYIVSVMIGTEGGGFDTIGSFDGSKNSLAPNIPLDIFDSPEDRKMLSGESVVIKIARRGLPSPVANAYTIQLIFGSVSGTSRFERPVMRPSSAGVDGFLREEIVQSFYNWIVKSGVGEQCISVPLQDQGGSFALIDPKTRKVNAAQSHDFWKYVYTTSSYSTTSTTPQNVTDLYFTPTANLTYLVEAHILLESSATNNAARIGASWPLNLTDGAGHYLSSLGASTGVLSAALLGHSSNTRGTNITSAGQVNWPGTGNVPYLTTGFFLFSTQISTSGTFQVTLASETAGTTVRVKAGSLIRYRTIP